MVNGLLDIIRIGKASNQEPFAVRMEVVGRAVKRLEGGSAFPLDGSIRNEYPFVYAVLYREDLPFPCTGCVRGGKEQLLIGLGPGRPAGANAFNRDCGLSARVPEAVESSEVQKTFFGLEKISPVLRALATGWSYS